MSSTKKPIWIARDNINCSGCRLCEIACSIKHEGKMWPAASRVRVFMLIPTLEVPHLCAQCEDAPCIPSCPVKALNWNADTGAILVDDKACTSCGICLTACPGRVPFLHPATNKATICDLCDGEPECAKVCEEGGYRALRVVDRSTSKTSVSYRLYSKTPDKVTSDLAYRLYGDTAKELI
jgi:Fe-S-cluster-containing hydrogenase component 2